MKKIKIPFSPKKTDDIVSSTLTQEQVDLLVKWYDNLSQSIANGYTNIYADEQNKVHDTHE